MVAYDDLVAAGSIAAVRALAEQADELVMDDLYDLLARGDALQHLLARALGLHPLDELPGDPEMDVGCEERGPDLAQRSRHVLVGKLAHPAQVSQRGGEFVCQGFKHASPSDGSTGAPTQLPRAFLGSPFGRPI